MIVDKNGKEVKIGSFVKVLYIEPGFISTHPHKEAKILEAMINKTFEVVDIQHEKAVLVEQLFNRFNGFQLALDSEEMELVDSRA